MIEVETIVNGPFMGNCYVLYDREIGKAIIIDPGAEPDLILGFCEESGLEVDQIICTHGHIDHVGAAAEIKKRTDAQLKIHRAEEALLDRLPYQTQMFGLPPVEIPEIDEYLDEGDEIEFAGEKIKVIETTGHSPGGISFVFDKKIFTGDALFAGSIGRTDLPGGDYNTLINSIKKKILTLGNDYTVYSGHGPESTVGAEKRSNPFLI